VKYLAISVVCVHEKNFVAKKKSSTRPVVGCFFLYCPSVRTDHRRGFDGTTDEGTQLRGRDASRLAADGRSREIQTVLGQTRVVGLVGVLGLGTVLEERVHGRQQQQHQSESAPRASGLCDVLHLSLRSVFSRFWNS